MRCPSRSHLFNVSREGIDERALIFLALAHRICRPSFPVRLRRSASFNPEPAATVLATIAAGSGLNDTDSFNRTGNQGGPGKIWQKTPRIPNCLLHEVFPDGIEKQRSRFFGNQTVGNDIPKGRVT